jgi:fructose-1,6-bisphosphatase/inositol monophosphatase family enzyme
LDLCYVAAGKLIVAEAGGRVTDVDGEALNIYDQETLAAMGGHMRR